MKILGFAVARRKNEHRETEDAEGHGEKRKMMEEAKTTAKARS